MTADAACQTPGGQPQAVRFPWADDPRAEDKTALFKYALHNPAGVRPAVAARAVVATDATAGDADARLARRFYTDHADLFKTDRRDGNLWVEPRAEAFHLTTNKHSPKHAEGGGTELDTAEAVLSKRRTLTTGAQRGALLQQLAAKRHATEGRYNVFRDRRDPSNHLAVPYRTRFNSPRRVAEQRDRFATAWDRAAGRFDVGQVWTLTTDPARFESLQAATQSLMDDVARFKSWLATDARLGSRPPALVVPEFTESGLPHVHLCLFGVGYLPHGAVSAYWAGQRDRGEVVWCDRIAARGGTWRWATDGRPDRAEGRQPQQYLGKTLADAAALASASPEAVQEAATALRRADETPAPADGTDAPSDGERDPLADGRRWWALALYYATGLRFYTLSPVLKRSTPDADGGLPYVPRWEYVGTARFGDLPGHVQRSATVVRRSRSRPPPGTDGPPPGQGEGSGSDGDRTPGERTVRGPLTTDI